MKTILAHANLIDCVEPQVRPDTAVLIEDGRILAILASGEGGNAGDAQMIDLKGGYLMPGLWDMHIHPDCPSLDEMPLVDQVALFGHRLAASRILPRFLHTHPWVPAFPVPVLARRLSGRVAVRSVTGARTASVAFPSTRVEVGFRQETNERLCVSPQGRRRPIC